MTALDIAGEKNCLDVVDLVEKKQKDDDVEVSSSYGKDGTISQVTSLFV